MDQDALNQHIKASFDRLGVALKGRRITGLGNVECGYTLTHITNTHFKNGAEAVLQEPDPESEGRMRVFAVFPQAAPAKK